VNDIGYLRQPALRGDTVVFVCDDDLWTVCSGGGVARRLTAGLGEPSTPALSPDGRWLAYVSRDEQHPEVYLMAAEGGPARRMTWLGPDVMVRGFTPDGRILFVTTHGQPFVRNCRACALSIEGGLPEMLPYGQVNHLAYGSGGKIVIGRNTADPARWKRYRGGTAGYLWVDAEGRGEFRRMNELKGNISSPMWLGERIYFLSDFEGVGNLYSCLPDGADLKRHTDHNDYYARHASSDGLRIVYQCGGDLWLFEPAGDEARRLDIRVPAHRTQAARRFVDAADNLDGFELHPEGHSLALCSRGKLFSFALWEGAVRQYGQVQGVRYRLGRWLADGAQVVVSDATGEERIELIEGERRARSTGTSVGSSAWLRRRRAAAWRLPTIATKYCLATSTAARCRSSTAATAGAARNWRGRPTARGLPILSGPIRGTARSSSATSTLAAALWSHSRSSATVRRFSIRPAATFISARYAPSIRSTTTFSSS